MGGPAIAAAINTCAVKTPGEAYHLIANKGADTSKYSSGLVFAQSFYAGCYIGFGALLAGTISSNMKGATADNPGLESFIFAGLFPVNLLLILLSGGILFTGTSAACPAAVFEGKIGVIDAARCLALSWVGNVLGSALFAYFTLGCKLLEPNSTTAYSMVKITEKKCSKSFFVTFLKGIGCNWMVCMAVFLCGMAQDMCGKYLGIWFPISCFVMCGFEHIPANFYITICGLIVESDTDITFWDVLWKNWIPVTLGNFFAGAICVALGYSCIFGNIGNKLNDLVYPQAPKPAEEAPAEPVVVEKEPVVESKDGCRWLPDDDIEPKTPAPKAVATQEASGWDRCISEGSLAGC